MRMRTIGLVLLSLWIAPAAGPAADEKPEPLGLQDLLDLALAHDGRIRAAHAKLGAVRARLDQARWAWFPKIEIEAGLGGPVGERKLACPDDPSCVQLESKDATGLGSLSETVSVAVGGKIEAAMPIYTFGKIDAAQSAAKAGVDAGLADIDRIRQQVALEVRRAWYGWLVANLAVEELERGVRKIDKTEKKLLEMLEELNENVTDRDLFKLRYKAAQVRSLLVKARRGKRTARAALRFLTGLDDLGGGRPLSEFGLRKPAIDTIDRAVYLRQALQQRPEMIMLRAAVRAQRAAVEAERARFYPDIFLAGRFKGSYSPAHDYIDNSLLNRGLTYYTGGLTLGLKLGLDIPRKLGELEQAEAKLHRVELQLEQARAALGLEIDKRLEQLRAARENARIMRRGQSSAKAWMRSNMMSYGVGITNTKDLLDSVAANAQARIERDRAIHDMLLARDRLLATIGADLGRVD